MKTTNETPVVNPWPGRVTITLDELAQAVGVCRRTIKRLEADGKLPGACSMGRKKLVRVADALAWIAAGMPR